MHQHRTDMAALLAEAAAASVASNIASILDAPSELLPDALRAQLLTQAAAGEECYIYRSIAGTWHLWQAGVRTPLKDLRVRR